MLDGYQRENNRNIFKNASLKRLTQFNLKLMQETSTVTETYTENNPQKL